MKGDLLDANPAALAAAPARGDMTLVRRPPRAELRRRLVLLPCDARVNLACTALLCHGFTMHSFSLFKRLKRLVIGAALVALLFTLTGCEELFGPPEQPSKPRPVAPPSPPPVRPEPEVAAPTFGGLAIPDQLYKRGEAIAPISLPAGYHGDGPLSYGFSVPGGVPGLSFSAGTRELSGTPTAVGRYAATYTVTDRAGAAESLSFTITVTDATGTLDVRSDPAGAVVHLNAVDTGLRTPAVIEVPAGTHEVMMVRSGFVPVLSSARVNAGQRAQVTGTFDYATGLGDDEPDVPAAPDDLPPLFGDRSLWPASHETRGSTEFIDMSPFFPPAGQQADAPTCAYFATAYLASHMITLGNHKFNGTDEDEIADMSPGFLWTVERPRAGYRGAFDRLKRYGISSESEAPYYDHVTCGGKAADYENDTDCWERPTDDAIQQAVKYKASVRKIQGITTEIGLYSSVPHRNRKFRRALYRGYAVALSVRSCKLKEAGGSSPYIWGKKEARCPFNWNDYHAVVLVGYDHDKGPHGAFKFINSWGESWGDGGYGWMGYDIPTSHIRAAYILYPTYNPWPPIPGESSPEPPPEPVDWQGTGAVAAQTYTVGQPIATLTLPMATGGSGRLSYSLSASPRWPSGLSFNGGTRRLTGTPAAGSAGSYAMTYTVTDGVGTTATLSFTITVEPGPDPPPPDPPLRWLGTVDAQNFTIGTPVSVTLPRATGGSGRLSYGLSASPSWPSGLIFDSGTRRLSGTPGAGSAGTYAMTYTVTDGVSTTATLSFTITVKPEPPTTGSPPHVIPGRSLGGSYMNIGGEVDSTGAATVHQTSIKRIDHLFSDPDGDTLEFSAQSSDATIATVGFNPFNTAQLSQLFVRARGLGRASITVTATDPTGLSASVSGPVVVVDGIYFDGENWERDYQVGERIDIILPFAVCDGCTEFGSLVYDVGGGLGGDFDIPGLSFNPATRVLSGVVNEAGEYEFTYGVRAGRIAFDGVTPEEARRHFDYEGFYTYLSIIDTE